MLSFVRDGYLLGLCGDTLYLELFATVNKSNDQCRKLDRTDNCYEPALLSRVVCGRSKNRPDAIPNFLGVFRIPVKSLCDTPNGTCHIGTKSGAVITTATTFSENRMTDHTRRQNQLCIVCHPKNLQFESRPEISTSLNRFAEATKLRKHINFFCVL